MDLNRILVPISHDPEAWIPRSEFLSGRMQQLTVAVWVDGQPCSEIHMSKASANSGPDICNKDKLCSLGV